jgi:hypothetical protein
MSGPAAKDWTSRAEKVVNEPIIPTAQNCRVVCENLPRYIDSYIKIPRKKQPVVLTTRVPGRVRTMPVSTRNRSTAPIKPPKATAANAMQDSTEGKNAV